MRSTTSTKKLYFIAILLPEAGACEVTTIKEYFRDTHGSKAALRSPPHITLHMPFSWPDKKLDQLEHFIETFAQDREAINLILQNFKSFPPRVIYVDVLPNPQLTELQLALVEEAKKDLKLFNANYKDRPFVPHVTLAFRDLRKSAYYSAWETFSSKEFHYQFLATEISLLKHDGKVWRVVNGFPFGAH